ncbi:bifunctional indole-3-glycerol-phosphate synthase TrpC/phosphoribosylanthranilate isomerase TrpF [Alkalimonas collagenimarina]|uniref:Multifunctional fusion protein n=1 Tax=Alkalimonas collagenimarina TaxID=400390 RepID=A0ABT9H1X6_9GAMM|nr:bifunctional indole-3-glycerol-phosphate synthase TrpC/phosphoribosylanthranilate isomerase TrpF [Alkalimonas collagenimarina]MDP4537311.1 bifunctional indole-3-glycerol-phosphate synthase TrpC/phosphoribosylanthranilate isomerase TrpF [Alkalimonas collagenimarina]
MADILKKIIEHKQHEVAKLKADRPLDSFLHDVKATERKFLDALRKSGPRFILECKKASPSKGLIRDNFDLDELSTVYGEYADCISVLTDQEFFQGSYDNLSQMRALVQQPLLHKDFIIDPYQIYLGRLCGADAVLLMLSVLSDDEYRQLHDVASSFAMTVLTEVSNEEETKRAVAMNAQLIGINNRDLRDLSTDLDTSIRLRKLIPKNTVVVSESGIYTNQQVRQLSMVADAFLVGSSLMAQPNLALACKKLTRGEHKICGLTRPEDVAAAHQAQAYYGGLIFYPKSPRAVDLEHAKTLVKQADLNFVGVFVNEPADIVSRIATELKLTAVQLHGEETDDYINTLRSLLPEHTEIWKAYRVKNKLPTLTQDADRIVLDTYQAGTPGGTGEQFSWQLLAQLNTKLPVMLAGGLQASNINDALQQPVAGLDLNSGLETEPGIKSADKIATAFQIIREFHYE